MTPSNSQAITRVYQTALKESPRGVKSYRWSSRKEQESRLEALLEVAGPPSNLSGKTLLDVGCGRGDLYQYLKRKQIDVKYTGIDMIPEFINNAKKYHKNAKFIEKEFFNWQTDTTYDYVIASGFLSVRVENNQKYIHRAVNKMWGLARHGMAFNFLTKFRQEKFLRWYYYDPGAILDMCMHLPGIQNISLEMGYDPTDKLGDASVLINKNNS